MPKFEKTYCSNCGNEFGPGDSGYSHCFSHLSRDDQLAYLHESLETGASADEVKNLASISGGNDAMILAFAEAWFSVPVYMRCDDCGAEWLAGGDGEIHQHTCPRLGA